MGRGLTITRDRSGNVFYPLNLSESYFSGQYLDLSLENIALFTPLDIRSSIFSMAKIWVEDDKGNILENDPFIKLINNPNYSQSRVDFLYKHLWFKSLGNNLTRIIPRREGADITNIDNVDDLEHLIPGCISYNNINKVSKMILANSDKDELSNRKIKYTLSGVEKEISISDIAFFYDITNGMKDDQYFISPSRITSLIPALSNVDQAQKTKNINLKFAGKLLTTNKAMHEGLIDQMDPEEKKDIEHNLYSKDVIASQANLDVHSLANDYTKLLFDDQIGSELVKVLGAYGMNREILTWFQNGQTTHDNKGVGVAQWIQNSMNFECDDFANTWTTKFKYQEQGKKIKMSLNDLPVMEVMNEKRLEAKERKSKMFANLVKGGVTVENALIISELDKELDNGKNR